MLPHLKWYMRLCVFYIRWLWFDFNKTFALYSIGKNSAQTDEEKQRERQRNERELKHAELEAQQLKV